MLFGYPIQSIADNWLHDCLQESLCQIYQDVQNGNAPKAGLDLIPIQYQDKLRRYTSIHQKLDEYRTAFEQLNRAEQDQVVKMLKEQNQISDLLAGRCTCQTIGDLPASIRIPIKNLFETAFQKLTPLKLRDKQYKHIYDTTSHHICPFCGDECFDDPDAPREPLDHFLPEAKYPFAGANLRNLVPMGNKCNSRYKLTQDILWNENGTRRKVFDPYNHTSLRISLDNSQLFARENNQLPSWKIEFEPDSEEVSTWDNVFSIRERYERDILDKSFKKWLAGFAQWCKAGKYFPLDNMQLIDHLQQYYEYLDFFGYPNRYFL